MAVSTGALAHIEQTFAFLPAERGFRLLQSVEAPASAWYGAPNRRVIVSYDAHGSAAVEVRLEDDRWHDSLTLCDVLRLTVASAQRREGLVEPAAVIAELERMCALLREHCDAFLTGDLAGFRATFREAILVQRCRSLAMSALAAAEHRRSALLFDFIRDYWDDDDRSGYERACLADRARQPVHR